MMKRYSSSYLIHTQRGWLHLNIKLFALDCVLNYCHNLFVNKYSHYFDLPTPVAARSKVWVFSRSLAWIAGSNPTSGMDACLL
jgi:hypothetical protein